jgi:hypothetical protein
MQSKKIKLLIYLAVWKRPRITELCFIGLNRLKHHPDFDIQVLAVVSEPEMLPLCEKYGVHAVSHENLPLGRKKNFGLLAAAMLEFDYLMEIGSDTIILNELLDEYKREFFGVRDFFGIGDAAFIDSETQSCRRIGGASTYGGGRVISRRALEKINWKVWPDSINQGLDNTSVMNLAKGGFFYQQLKPGPVPLVFDIKSEVNIWPFNHLQGVEYDVNKLLERVSAEEIGIIKELWEEYATQQA